MVLREAQNHKNNILSFFIRKVNPNFELQKLLSDSNYERDYLLLCCFCAERKNNTTTSLLFFIKRLFQISNR